MNKLAYRMELQKIKDMKYVKDLELAVRKYAQSSYTYRTSTDIELIQDIHLAMVAMYRFEEKSSKILPDAIYRDMKYSKTKLMGLLYEENLPIDYVVEVLEFGKDITLNRSEGKNLTKLVNLLGNTPVGANFNYNLTPHGTFTYCGSQITDSGPSAQWDLAVQLAHMKHFTPPTHHLYIDDALSKIGLKDSKYAGTVDRLQQNLDNMNKAMTVIKTELAIAEKRNAKD